MSEPVRRRIVEILASGEHTSGEVTDTVMVEFGVTRSAVSRHLRILRDDNVVIVRAEWVNRLYRLDPGFLPRLRHEVRHFEQLWKRRTGVMARDVDPWVPTQLPVGGRKGKRAKSRNDDAWAR